MQPSMNSIVPTIWEERETVSEQTGILSLKDLYQFWDKMEEGGRSGAGMMFGAS